MGVVLCEVKGVWESGVVVNGVFEELRIGWGDEFSEKTKLQTRQVWKINLGIDGLGRRGKLKCLKRFKIVGGRLRTVRPIKLSKLRVWVIVKLEKRMKRRRRLKTG